MIVGALCFCAQNSPRKRAPSADENVTARRTSVGGKAADVGKIQPPHCGVPCSTVTPGRVNSRRNRRPRTNMTPPTARPSTTRDAAILVNQGNIYNLLKTKRMHKRSVYLEREVRAFVPHPSLYCERLYQAGVFDMIQSIFRRREGFVDQSMCLLA